MPVFYSSKEKRYWLYAALVVFAILATLAFGRPLQEALFDQQLQAVLFLSGLLLCTAAVIVYGLQHRLSTQEVYIWLGLAAVYTMLVFRLGAPERSHLIEYSVLALFIHRALLERPNMKHRIWLPAGLAFIVTFGVGAIDELLQLVLPERVFDPEDMVFNGLAAFMAMGSSLLLRWARQRFGRHFRNDQNPG